MLPVALHRWQKNGFDFSNCDAADLDAINTICYHLTEVYISRESILRNPLIKRTDAHDEVAQVWIKALKELGVRITPNFQQGLTTIPPV